MIVASEGGDYVSPPLSPWQRKQGFVIESEATGSVIRGHFLDGAEGASYTMKGEYDNLHAVRVFVRAGADPKRAAGMLRRMAQELEGLTLER